MGKEKLGRGVLSTSSQVGGRTCLMVLKKGRRGNSILYRVYDLSGSSPFVVYSPDFVYKSN